MSHCEVQTMQIKIDRRSQEVYMRMRKASKQNKNNNCMHTRLC